MLRIRQTSPFFGGHGTGVAANIHYRLLVEMPRRNSLIKKVRYVAQLSKYTFHQSNMNQSPGTSTRTGFSLLIVELTLSALDYSHTDLPERSALPPTKVLTCSLFGSSERPFSKEGSPMSMVSSFGLPASPPFAGVSLRLGNLLTS